MCVCVCVCVVGMNFYRLKLQCKVSCKNRLRWDTWANKKLLELQYNGSIVNINYRGHINSFLGFSMKPKAFEQLRRRGAIIS